MFKLPISSVMVTVLTGDWRINNKQHNSPQSQNLIVGIRGFTRTFTVDANQEFLLYFNVSVVKNTSLTENNHSNFSNKTFYPNKLNNIVFFVDVCSMNPGDSKAIEGMQNVERANGGEMEHDSGDEAEETNGGVSLEEVLVVCQVF